MENIQGRADKIGNEVNGARQDLSSRFANVKEQVKEAAGEMGQQAMSTAKSVANEVRDEGKLLADQICSQTSKSVQSARDYVSNNPFRSLAAAAGVGLLFGYLRRR